MGATESKLAFRKGVFRLFEERNIPFNDDYWSQFWRLPESADDVFSLVGAQDIRRVRDQARENLETLINKVIDRILRILRAPDFPSLQNSTLHLLNCIRILTRLIPFIFESEEMGDWEEKFFWTPQLKKVKKNRKTDASENPQDLPQMQNEATNENLAKESSQGSQTQNTNFETIPPLGERLLSVIIDLLFLAGFTLPATLAKDNGRIIYVNWETGVGSTIPIGSSKENDYNKTETLRLLLVLISKSMYMSGATYIGKENKWIKYLVLKIDLKVILALLCSLLNTAVKYDPTGWGVPYNHVVFADSREMLVTMCLQVLLVLLDYRAPSNRIITNDSTARERQRTGSVETVKSEKESITSPTTKTPDNLTSNETNETARVDNNTQDNTSPAEATSTVTTPNTPKGQIPSHVDNAFRYYASKLHRAQDFQFIMDGIYRILSNPMQANNTYLPGSTKQIRCHQEMMMLCWKFIETNKRFRNYLLETDKVLDLLVVLLYYSIENKQDSAQLGLVRMCAFILQTLSGDRDFGVKLNKVFENHGSLPANVRIHAFNGTYADYMISSIYALIATTRGTLHSLYHAYVLTITNVSPYLKNLSVVSSTKLVHLFSQFTSSTFLLAEEGNHRLVEYLLEAFNNIIQYQFSDNPHLIYAILRSPKCFEDLSEFTLAKGLIDIKKIQAAKEQRKKQVRIAAMEKTSELSEVKNSQDELSRPSMSDNESNLSTQKDEDRGEINEKPELQASSNIDITSQDSQIEISDHDLVPLSEKARGKLPEGVTAASRRKSNDSIKSNSINNIVPTFAVGKSGFVPTEDWVSSWHSHFPLGTILILLGELVPKIEDICVSRSINSDQPVLEFLRKVTMVGILPPPQPILIRKFQWSEASVVWFSSLLWGQIYLASSNYLGIFNGTQVKLFFIKPPIREGRLKNAIGNAVGGVQGVIDRLSTANTANPVNPTNPTNLTSNNNS
ncbi:19593_t:CDS:10 [Funneliformis geosporum]|uniref:2715_t:CDS:1 n=1 Tax=Funneliformis geosporum TaxID=1117311 RepID=A0A9W4SUR8_9GLOM|nr:19593_t:CDS:10 [Funneliformis geosporum]CAI2181632.1 2715_t:CDS:10 [Funneliformis geosporum]